MFIMKSFAALVGLAAVAVGAPVGEIEARNPGGVRIFANNLVQKLISLLSLTDKLCTELQFEPWRLLVQ